MSQASLKEIENMFQTYLDQKSVQINNYIRKQVEEYTADLYIQILIQWDDYLRSYTPKMYQRTGNTARGINPTNARREGDKIVASVEFENSMMYGNSGGGVGSSKTTGHSYSMIDLGWEDRNLKPNVYMYSYYSGYGMTGNAISILRSKLPDYIDIEIKTKGSGLGGRQSQYSRMNK